MNFSAKIFFVVATLLFTVANAEESKLPDEAVSHYEDMGGNLHRALYRMPGFFYIPPTADFDRQTYQQWFESEGLTFGPGTFAKFSDQERILELVQTADQITFAEILLLLEKPVHSIRIGFDLYELSPSDAKTLAALSTNLPDLLKAEKWVGDLVESGEAIHLRGASTKTLSGYVGKVGWTEGKILVPDSKGEDETPREISWGSFLKLDPVLSFDGQIVDVNFEFTHAFASPQIIKKQGEAEIIYQKVRIASTMTCFNSLPYFVAAWENPDSSLERVQALVIKLKVEASGVVERVREVK